MGRIARGFSLAELAVVLAILALLAAGALSALRVQREQAGSSDTRAALELAKEALYAYAEVNLGLPCPDTTEPPDGIADACSNTIRRGYLPWKELGLTSGNDGWQHPLRYAVTWDLVAPTLSTKTLKTATGDIQIVADDTSATYEITPSAVAFALWSPGPDGVNASGTQAAPSTRINIGSATSPADDVVIWGSRYVMMGRALQAGQSLQLE